MNPSQSLAAAARLLGRNVADETIDEKLIPDLNFQYWTYISLYVTDLSVSTTG